jgi:hypothetical protein
MKTRPPRNTEMTVKGLLEAMGKIAPTASVIAAFVGLIVAIASPIFYFGKLESRIETLETQVHILTVSPVIANSAEKTVVANPVADTCAQLARKLADVETIPPINNLLGPQLLGPDLSSVTPQEIERLRSIMADLGCSLPK